MTEQHPPHKMPTAAQMDQFTDAFTKIVAAGLSAGLLEKPEEFFVVSVRSGDAWNMGTGKPSDWHRDTIALAEAEILREISKQTDVILSPTKGMTVQDAVAAFNDVLASLTRDLIANADRIDPT